MDLDESFGRRHASTTSALYPSDRDIERVAEIFWKSPAHKRSRKADSSLAIDQTFAIPKGAELDFPTFCKLIALVQKPEKRAKHHSEEQRKGWRSAFDLIDADGMGALSREKVDRFLVRRRRVRGEAERSQAVRDEREQKGASGSVLATELQARVDQHLKEKRQRDAALETIDEAMAGGGSLDELFALVMALAPPLFGCERASLWVVRPLSSDDGDDAPHDALAEMLMHGPNAFHGEWEDAWCSFCKRELFTNLGAAHCNWASSVSVAAAAAAAAGPRGSAAASVEDKHEASHNHPMSNGEEARLLVNKYSIAGSAASLFEPQNVADCYQDPRFDDRWDAKTGFVTSTMLCLPVMAADLPLTEDQRVEARLLGIPAFDRPRCVGVLQLVNKLPKGVFPPSTFSSKEMRTGVEFCRKLASAIEEAVPRMLAEKAREKALMAARMRRRKNHAAAVGART